MALVNCKECGKDVSRSAKSCPHCGFPIRQIWRAYLVFGSAIIGLVGGYIAGHLLVSWWLGLLLAYFGFILLPIGVCKVIGDHPYAKSGKLNWFS